MFILLAAPLFGKRGFCQIKHYSFACFLFRIYHIYYIVKFLCQPYQDVSLGFIICLDDQCLGDNKLSYEDNDFCPTVLNAFM
jgi:hypothetical protein